MKNEKIKLWRVRAYAWSGYTDYVFSDKSEATECYETSMNADKPVYLGMFSENNCTPHVVYNKCGYADGILYYRNMNEFANDGR